MSPYLCVYYRSCLQIFFCLLRVGKAVCLCRAACGWEMNGDTLFVERNCRRWWYSSWSQGDNELVLVCSRRQSKKCWWACTPYAWLCATSVYVASRGFWLSQMKGHFYCSSFTIIRLRCSSDIPHHSICQDKFSLFISPCCQHLFFVCVCV